MELIVFDLDGTLLNRDSEISEYTSETLRRLRDRNIAYTVATGRTLHASRAVLAGHRFDLPQAYKNGVMIWHPDEQRLASGAMLTATELECVVSACLDNGVTPFVFTLGGMDSCNVYHPTLQHNLERSLIRRFTVEGAVQAHALETLPANACITHVNAIAGAGQIEAVVSIIAGASQLVAYSGEAFEGARWRWLDVHHSDASKGGAIAELKIDLGFERVICFGDSANDLSMFEHADESYAPANATDAIKAAATAVIGHHDEDGIARFLRERFLLDSD